MVESRCTDLDWLEANAPSVAHSIYHWAKCKQEVVNLGFRGALCASHGPRVRESVGPRTPKLIAGVGTAFSHRLQSLILVRTPIFDHLQENGADAFT